MQRFLPTSFYKFVTNMIFQEPSLFEDDQNFPELLFDIESNRYIASYAAAFFHSSPHCSSHYPNLSTLSDSFEEEENPHHKKEEEKEQKDEEAQEEGQRQEQEEEFYDIEKALSQLDEKEKEEFDNRIYIPDWYHFPENMEEEHDEISSSFSSNLFLLPSFVELKEKND